jgi:PilZ domain-containing protein
VSWQKLKKLFSSAAVLPHTRQIVRKERRSAVRKRQRLMQGYIWSEHMAFSKACIVRNLSATGARIDLLSSSVKTHTLTGTITLYFQADRREIDCQVAWRTGRSVGLRFIGSFRPPTRAYGTQGAVS